MKKYVKNGCFALLVMVVLFSCATAPEEPSKVPESAPVVKEESAPKLQEEPAPVVEEAPPAPEPAPAKLPEIEEGVVLEIPEGRPAGVGEEIEPNNKVEEANYADLGKAITLSINPAGDRDWFRVFVQQQGYLQLQARNVPDGLGLDVQYCTYDEWDGVAVVRNWSRIPDGCFVTPGEYYLCLNDDYGDAASEKAFPFRISFLKEIDAGEPNNTPEEATPVSPGQTVGPAIYPKGDVDWYTVEVEKQGYIRLLPRDVPEGIGLDARFCIYDEWDGITVVRNWGRVPTGCPVQPGVYHFCLNDDYGDAAADKAFPLLVEFRDEMDPAEPNNNPDDAKAFTPGEVKTMAIYPMGDEDYYAVKLDKAGTLALQAQEVPGNLGLQATLIVPDPDNPGQYLRVDDYKNMPASFALEAGQQYYLLFVDDWNDADSLNPFKVRMTLE